MTIPAIAPPEIVLGHPAGARATMGELMGACSGVRCDRIRSRGSQSGRSGNGYGAVECRLHLPLEFARVCCFFSPTLFVLDFSYSGGISHQDDVIQGGSATISSISSETKVPKKRDRGQKRDESEGKSTRNKILSGYKGKSPLFQHPQPPHPALTSRARRPWHPRKVAICFQT